MNEYHTTILVMLFLTVAISVLSTVAVINEIDDIEIGQALPKEAISIEKDVSTTSQSTALVVVTVHE